MPPCLLLPVAQQKCSLQHFPVPSKQLRLFPNPPVQAAHLYSSSSGYFSLL